MNGSVEEIALVNTSLIHILIDRKFTQEIDVKLIGRRIKITVADRHEIIGNLAIADKLVVEDEILHFAHVLVIDFSEELAKRLEGLGLSKQIILRLITIEALGLSPDIAIEKLRKVEIFC